MLLDDVLQQRPLGLVFDIDGTLSPIAITPDTARLYPGVARLLAQANEYAQVAIITGRTVDNGAAMVNVEGLTYIGSHGLEWSNGLPSTHDVEIVPEALAYREPGKKLLDLAAARLGSKPGVLIERKRIGGAVHYRLCPDPEQMRRRIFSLLEEPARQANMRLSEGKRVVEIKSPLEFNKGHALRNLVHRFDLHGVLFAGDDRTDLDGILEIARLRKEEGRVAISIAVEHHDTPPALLENADEIVQEVEGLVERLQYIVERLQTIEERRRQDL
jgi:trehalose 6-phosphate phosphatase